MKKINLPQIYIKWLDHCWVAEDIKKIPDIKNARPYFIEELGFLITQDNEKIVYCQRITEGFDGKRNNVDYEGTTIVLKKLVKKMVYLSHLNSKEVKGE